MPLIREKSLLTVKTISRQASDKVAAGFYAFQRVVSGFGGKDQRVSGTIQKTELGELLSVNEYRIEKVIGSGAHATVYLGVDKLTNKKYAIKAITHHLRKDSQKKNTWSRGPMGPGPVAAPTSETYNPERMLGREIAIMKKLEHENVVKLYEAIEDFDTNEVFLVMEYLEQGTVMPEKTCCDPLPLDRCWTYFRQLISALEYCHGLGVIHCDIKPANLLLDGDRIKVADFGTSRLMGEHSQDPSSTKSKLAGLNEMVSKIVGTSAFLSPQAHSGDHFSGVQNDVWSVGVTLFFFVYGKCPFSGESIIDVHDNVMEQALVLPERPEVPESLKDLMVQMMDKGEDQRITLEEIMSHPWVTKDGAEPMARIEFKPINVTAADCQLSKSSSMCRRRTMKPRGGNDLGQSRIIVEI